VRFATRRNKWGANSLSRFGRASNRFGSLVTAASRRGGQCVSGIQRFTLEPQSIGKRLHQANLEGGQEFRNDSANRWRPTSFVGDAFGSTRFVQGKQRLPDIFQAFFDRMSCMCNKFVAFFSESTRTTLSRLPRIKRGGLRNRAPVKNNYWRSGMRDR